MRLLWAFDAVTSTIFLFHNLYAVYRTLSKFKLWVIVWTLLNEKAYIAPLATYWLATGRLCFIDGLAFSLGHSPCPHTQTLDPADIQPYSAPVCRYNGLQPHNPWRYMDYYSFTNPGGIEDLSWPSWLTHSRQFTHKVVINDRSGAGQGMSAAQRPDVLIIELWALPTSLCCFLSMPQFSIFCCTCMTIRFSFNVDWSHFSHKKLLRWDYFVTVILES